MDIVSPPAPPLQPVRVLPKSNSQVLGVRDPMDRQRPRALSGRKSCRAPEGGNDLKASMWLIIDWVAMHGKPVSSRSWLQGALGELGWVRECGAIGSDDNV